MDTLFFRIANITIQFDTDLDLHATRLNPALTPFLVDKPGNETVHIKRIFQIPGMEGFNLGKEIFRGLPWVVYENEHTGHVYYQGIKDTPDGFPLWTFADFQKGFSEGTLYSDDKKKKDIEKFGLHNLTGFPSDSLWLSPLLANRGGIYMHSSAVLLNGSGLLFIGRSEAGKTTTLRMFKRERHAGKADITTLCDEGNILRYQENGWHVHGTWGHGDEPEVSGLGGLLNGIFILKQDTRNTLVKVEDSSVKVKNILSTVIRPIMVKTWWEKEMALIDKLVKEVPFYVMHFDPSGEIIHHLSDFVNKQRNELL